MSHPELRSLQVSQGGVFAPAAVADEPVQHFGDPAAEYRASVQRAALFDLSDWTQIEITGAGARGFLHSFCTNDIQRLQPGQGCEAFVTNIKGRILGFVHVFAGDEAIWLSTVPGQSQPLLKHLGKYILTDDIQLHVRTDAQGMLYLAGPLAPETCAEFPIRGGPPVESGDHTGAEVAAVPCTIARCDLLSMPGFLLRAPHDQLPALWTFLTDRGIVPAGRRAFHALRIESGYPWYGQDLTEDQIAQEAGRTSRAISFQKGCYLGQEPIARLDALGHVNQELRGLRLASQAVPAVGAPILTPDGRQEIGRVTSAGTSYADGQGIVLAMVRRQYTPPGSLVKVRVPGGAAVSATVFWLD